MGLGLVQGAAPRRASHLRARCPCVPAPHIAASRQGMKKKQLIHERPAGPSAAHPAFWLALGSREAAPPDRGRESYLRLGVDKRHPECRSEEARRGVTTTVVLTTLDD